MKRSEFIQLMVDDLKECNPGVDEALIRDGTERFLALAEKHGIQPPKVESIKVRGKDFPWGGGCNMRCDCDECNPRFLVTKWEKE